MLAFFLFFNTYLESLVTDCNSNNDKSITKSIIVEVHLNGSLYLIYKL